MELDSYFSLIVGGDCVTHNKPNPEPYLTAMSKLGLAPSECIVIEDSASGIHAGKAAGAYVVAYTGTQQSRIRLRQIV